MKISRYETDQFLEQYLLFHYGSDQDLLPYPFGPKESLHFPLRCVEDCVELSSIPKGARALEIGCAVGRSSFELARHFEKVVAIDTSHRFIQAAKEIQEKGELKYFLSGEGTKKSLRIAKRPDIDPKRINFKCQDVMEISQERPFQTVLAANVICRLSDPLKFLKALASLVSLEGQLILISPYAWLEEFTPQNLWLGQGEKSALEEIQKILAASFVLKRHFEMPFFLRESLRKYQWGVSQASLWKRI